MTKRRGIFEISWYANNILTLTFCHNCQSGKNSDIYKILSQNTDQIFFLMTSRLKISKTIALWVAYAYQTKANSPGNTKTTNNTYTDLKTETWANYGFMHIKRKLDIPAV